MYNKTLIYSIKNAKGDKTYFLVLEKYLGSTNRVILAAKIDIILNRNNFFLSSHPIFSRKSVPME